MNFPRGLIKGEVRTLEKLSSHTSFRIGGPAAVWAEPRDMAELKKIVRFAKARAIRTFVLGGGTNVLASDNGFGGIIIHLGSPQFRKAAIKGTTVTVGAGYATPKLIKLCCSRGLGGLESLVGIPGTVGGAVFMNAGGWSSPLYKNIGDYVGSVKAVDARGRARTLKKNDIKFGYRSSSLAGFIITEVTLKLFRAGSCELLSRCSKFLSMKKEKQVLDAPSAGCVFKNPRDFQFTTGQMIDSLGLKGARVGGAVVSAKHANFIVNEDRATSADVLKLIEVVKKKVMENYNVPLELEIKVI
jgi:UDP-N-acetylmuramate dehydrogenase